MSKENISDTISQMPKTKTTKTAAKKTGQVKTRLPKAIPSAILKIPQLLKKYQSSKKFYIIIALLAITAIAFYEKKWIIAATVNGSPISNFELMGRLNAQYREQTLTQMINEKIVLDEAKKKGVIVKNSDIDSKIAEIEKNVGGAQVLDSMLAQQGQTRQTLRDQVKIQLIIEKLYQNEATVSAKEIEDFIAQNKDQLTATDSAKQQEEATQILKQQRLSQVFSQKFQELKQSAKIKIF